MCTCTSLEIIRLLHELLGADVLNAPDKLYGNSPLFVAASNGSFETICVLCELGADVNAQDKHGISPVLFAAQEGLVEVVCVLAEHGADLNANDKDGGFPVWRASQQGHVEVPQQ